MPLPKKYAPPLTPVIATYNYVDVAEGTGITTFNACTTNVAGTEKYFITTAEPYSNTIETNLGALGAGVTADKDFDTGELNLPIIVKGTATVNVTSALIDGGSYFLYAKLRKWDGTSETEIAQGSGSILATDGNLRRTILLKISDIPPTLITIGEQIRLTVGAQGVTAGGTAWIAHDPQNRDGTTFVPSTTPAITNKLIANIPFQIKTA